MPRTDDDGAALATLYANLDCDNCHHEHRNGVGQCDECPCPKWIFWEDRDSERC